MNRYHIYKVNGLGNKTRVETVLADQFEHVQNEFGDVFNFYQNKYGLFGQEKDPALVHVYSTGEVTLVVKD